VGHSGRVSDKVGEIQPQKNLWRSRDLFWTVSEYCNGCRDWTEVGFRRSSLAPAFSYL